MTENLAALFLLDPAVTFLNHGSYGACPLPVFESWQAWQRQLERQPVAFLEPARGWGARMRQVRVALAAEVGCDPEDLVGLTNATEALNVVAHSLDLAPGDEVLITDHEYSALEKTWAEVCQRNGARLVMAELPLPLTSADQFTDAIVAGMTDRTRVLFLSHVTSATALVLPIEPVLAIARARGIRTVIDGAHAPGQIALNLDRLGADFYAGNCHKWLMAPKGTGFLHVRREVQPLIRPLVVSHGWMPGVVPPAATGPFGNPAFIDRIEMRGTRDPSGWLAITAALDFRRQHGWDRVAAACSVLAQHTAARISRLTGLPALAAPAFTAPQMIAMPVPPCDAAVLKTALIDQFGIEIPCYRWQDRVIVRLSVQGYNSQADMDRLADALTLLLPQGAAI